MGTKAAEMSYKVFATCGRAQTCSDYSMSYKHHVCVHYSSKANYNSVIYNYINQHNPQDKAFPFRVSVLVRATSEIKLLSTMKVERKREQEVYKII